MTNTVSVGCDLLQSFQSLTLLNPSLTYAPFFGVNFLSHGRQQILFKNPTSESPVRPWRQLLAFNRKVQVKQFYIENGG